MGNPEHIDLVRRGAAAISDWRKTRRDGEYLDLARANLHGIDLAGADLSGASLVGAILGPARLAEARLTFANLDDADLSGDYIRSPYPGGPKLRDLPDDVDRRGWGANLKGARLDLARMSRAMFIGAILEEADLRAAVAVGANFSAVTLRGANLDGADLREANLHGSDLTGASLRRTKLQNANLTEAILMRTALSGAALDAADLTGARVSSVLWDSDLSRVYGLAQMRHHGPSIVSRETLAAFRGRASDAFLRGCGLSDWEIASVRLYAPNLTRAEIEEIVYDISVLRAGTAIQISPLFISYSHLDTAFVDTLDIELTRAGIRFWRDVKDIQAGRIEKQLTRAISMNPTFLLVLSEHSIRSDWIEWEASQARDLERQLGRDVLCPVALDEAWRTSDWSGPLRRQIERYHILDFSRWQDSESFERQFDKLVKGLALFYGEEEKTFPGTSPDGS